VQQKASTATMSR